MKYRQFEGLGFTMWAVRAGEARTAGFDVGPKLNIGVVKRLDASDPG